MLSFVCKGMVPQKNVLFLYNILIVISLHIDFAYNEKKNFCYLIKGCYAKPYNESTSQVKTVPPNIQDAVTFCKEVCQSYFLLQTDRTYQCITSNVPLGGLNFIVFLHYNPLSLSIFSFKFFQRWKIRSF